MHKRYKKVEKLGSPRVSNNLSDLSPVEYKELRRTHSENRIVRHMDFVGIFGKKVPKIVTPQPGNPSSPTSSNVSTSTTSPKSR